MIEMQTICIKKKMNDLVYVMDNLKLKSRQTRKTVALPFEDMEFDYEWITKEREMIFFMKTITKLSKSNL